MEWLRGTEGQRMVDNLTIDRCGRILLQEDPGDNPRVARVWLYGVKSEHLIEIARHNAAFFDPASLTQATFLTQDEESSGIIDAGHLLGRGWFLLGVQAHLANPDPELVQEGQRLALRVDPAIECDRDSPR